MQKSPGNRAEPDQQPSNDEVQVLVISLLEMIDSRMCTEMTCLNVISGRSDGEVQRFLHRGRRFVLNSPPQMH